MKNTVGINSRERGHDLQEPPAPPLLLRASSPRTPKRVKAAWILCGCLNTLQLPNLTVKSFFQNFSIKEQSFFPLLCPAPSPAIGLSRIWSWRAEEDGKEVFHWKFGDREILFLFFFLPSPSCKTLLLLIVREEYKYLKTGIFWSICQVSCLLVTRVLNLKLETPGYGWLFPESPGK